MALTLSVNNPSYPDGEQLEVGGVLVENGGSVSVDENQEAVFFSTTGKTMQDAIVEDENSEVSGTPVFQAPDAPEEPPTPPPPPPPPPEEPPPEEDGGS
jgi:hypothetical protein